jgi:peptide/nickel transport system permease protein
VVAPGKGLARMATAQGAIRGTSQLMAAPSVRLLGRRLLMAVPVLLGVSFFSFAIFSLLPGNAADAILGGSPTRQQIAQLTARLHLNEPFLARYGQWLGGVLTGHLGTSLQSDLPVASILAQRVPVTLELVLLSFIMAVGCAVVFAVLAALRPRGVLDRANAVVGMMGLSIPQFVLAVILSLILADKLHLFPAVGFVPISQGLLANVRSLILPAAALGFGLFGTYTRMLRSDLVDQLLGEDYIVLARAKGLSPLPVVLRHAMRNSLIGLLTLIGLNFGTLLGATVVVEQIFAIPGVGQQLFLSLNVRDIPVVEGIVLVNAVAVVLVNVGTDVLYSVVDPRIRHGNAGA